MDVKSGLVLFSSPLDLVHQKVPSSSILNLSGPNIPMPSQEAFHLMASNLSVSPQRSESGFSSMDYFKFVDSVQECTNSRNMLKGIWLHSCILRSTFQDNQFLGNLLVSMYAKFGHVDYAIPLFDRMPNRDLISWNAVIVAYAQNWQSSIALRLLQEMKKGCILPSRASYLSVLNACSCPQALAEGQLVHAHIVGSRYETDMVVRTSLVNMYGKCGSHQKARRLFDKMAQRDVVSWNAMITTYAQSGQSQEALHLFREMQQGCIKPDKVSFISILNVLSNGLELAEGRLVHAHVIGTGCELDIVVATSLVAMYGKCGDVESAQKVFDKMLMKNVISWDAIITAYGLEGNGRKALELFEHMKNECVKPDKVIFTTILNAFCVPEALAQGKLIHSYIICRGFQLDVILGNALISMYGKCESLQDTYRVYEKLLTLNVVSYNVLISVYLELWNSGSAFQIFRKMQWEGPNPSEITFVNILNACSNANFLFDGRLIHACVIENGHELNIPLANAIINMYVRCKCLENAHIMLIKYSHQSVVLWNAVINGYCEHGHYREAYHVFECMQQEGIKPSKLTYSAILEACSGLQWLAEGIKIHGQIACSGFDSDAIIACSLINMYGRCGSLTDARKAFDKVMERDVVLWTAMIVAHAQHGEGADALQHFQQMWKDAIEPNAITFVGILTACSHAGLVDEGCHQFNSISGDYGIEPSPENYACMIDMIGRVGWLEVTENLMNALPFQLNAVAWMILLSASKVDSDLERGQSAVDNLIKLDPENASLYVLLSNMFASSYNGED